MQGSLCSSGSQINKTEKVRHGVLDRVRGD